MIHRGPHSMISGRISVSMYCTFSKTYRTKGHSFRKQCLHILQFKKPMYSSPNLSKLARADISCQFKKARNLCRHCLQNEWTLTVSTVSFRKSVVLTYCGAYQGRQNREARKGRGAFWPISYIILFQPGHSVII